MKQLGINVIHFFITFLLSISGMLSLFKILPFGWPSVILVDIYILALLIFIALIGYKIIDPKFSKWLPNRIAALLILPCLLIALVSGFGNIYIQTNGVYSTNKDVKSTCKFASNPTADSSILECPFDAFYFSLVTITTLGYGDYVPTKEKARIAVIVELFSGVFLLILALPLLVSRLASYDLPNTTVSFTFQGLFISLPNKGIINLTNSTLIWTNTPYKLTVTFGENNCFTIKQEGLQTKIGEIVQSHERLYVTDNGYLIKFE